MRRIEELGVGFARVVVVALLGGALLAACSDDGGGDSPTDVTDSTNTDAQTDLAADSVADVSLPDAQPDTSPDGESDTDDVDSSVPDSTSDSTDAADASGGFVVTTTEPADGATGVALDAEIKFFMSADVSFGATQPAGEISPPVADASFLTVGFRNFVQVQSPNDLAPGTEYTVTLYAGLPGPDGATLAQNYSFSFTTAGGASDAFAFEDELAFEVDDDVADGTGGDLDGDGYADGVLVSPNNIDNNAELGTRIYVFHNDYAENGAWDAGLFDDPIELTGHRFLGVEVADVDGDGLQDIVAFTSSSEAVIFRYTGDGSSFTASDFTETVISGVEQAQPWLSSAVGDVNGDGLPDILAHHHNSQGTGTGLSVLLNTSTSGSVSFGAAQSSSTAGMYGRGAAAGDFDGDGSGDVVVSGVDGGGDWSALGVIWGTGTGSSWTPSAVDWIIEPDNTEDSQDYSDPFVVDVNGDGIDDIAVGADGAERLTEGLAVYLGNAGRTFDAPDYEQFFQGTLEFILGIDLDGAGFDDILGFDTVGGGSFGRSTNMYVFLNAYAGTGAFDETSMKRQEGNIQTKPGFFRPELADVDGDGVDDLIGAAREFGQSVFDDDGGALMVQRNATTQAE